MTAKHPLYKRLKGRLLHVTHVGGLRGILNDHEILSNPEGARGYKAVRGLDGRNVRYYHCQACDMISLLDFCRNDANALFDPEHRMHWTGVFEYHNPAIVLAFSEQFDISLARKPNPLDALGRFIDNGEVCYPSPINVAAVDFALVVNRDKKVLRESSNLSEILSYCERNQHKFATEPRYCGFGVPPGMVLQHSRD